tara:strand:+ start:20905 stop:22287 length:1383 start_codon:yes stop_codon:yes gene_type:complete
MAIYKTTSSKTIIRKVFRDINPNTDNWIDDAVEWIGEALEHIGSAPQLETKTCVLSMADYKAALPNDLFYINQVAINETAESIIISEQIDTLLEQIDNIVNGQSASNYTLNEINSRLQVLENQFGESDDVAVLTKCTTNFPKTADCLDCVNDNKVTERCYYIEADKIKTSFSTSKICLSYMAFPLDDDCYPLIPDDISFKEAMFWYVYKKMLLGNMTPSQNGIGYEFAEGQWKYYCTQARNAANYPDIDDYESFMNQWVRLVPNINRHAEGFAGLGRRESLDRNSSTQLVESNAIANKIPTKSAATNLTRRTTSVAWSSTTTTPVGIDAGGDPLTILNNPQSDEFSIIEGTSVITYGTSQWLLTGVTSSMTLTYAYTIDLGTAATSTLDVEVVMVNNATGQETVVGTTTYSLTDATTQIQGDETSLFGSIQSANVFIRIPVQSNAALTSVSISAGTLKIE